MKRLLLALLALATSVSIARRAALADGLNAQAFAPAEDGGAFVTSSDSNVLGEHGVNAGLFFNYVDSPLVTVNSITGKRTAVVENLSTFDAFATYAFHPIMQASVAIPYNLAAGASPTGKDIGGGAMGDIRVKGKLQIFNREKAVVGLAFLPYVNIPSGKAEAYVGDGSFTGGVNFAVDKELPVRPLVDDRAIVVGANAGLFGRKPASGGGKVELGSQMSYGASVNVPVLPIMDFVVDSFGRTLVNDPFGQIAGTPIEVEGALHLLTWRDKGVRITAGAGTGLTEGVGAPGFRLFTGVVLALPADKSQDRDHDGFLDDDDKCPDEPEDHHGYQSGFSFQYLVDDGCPDKRNWTVRGRSEDSETKAPVNAKVALIPPAPNAATAPGYFSFTTDADGPARLVAQAPGYAPYAQTIATTPGATTEFVVRMTAEKGTVDATIVDAWTREALSASLVASPGGATGSAKDGRIALALRPGAYTVTASTEGYESASTTVSVAANEILPVRLELPIKRFELAAKVVDARTLQPVVADVLLMERGAWLTGQSTADGMVKFVATPATSYTFRLSANGYETMNTAATPAALQGLVFKLQPKKIVVAEKKLVLDPIFFETGKDVILPESYTILDSLAEYLNENAAMRLSIEGHTDSKGSAQKNRVLSEKRAQAVRDALISRGVAADRLTAKGFGPDRPVAPNDTDENRAKNRRVEFIVVGE